MATTRAFETSTQTSTATSGSTTGLTPSFDITLQNNCSQVIIYNKDAAQTLYIFCYNINVDAAAVRLDDCLELGPGGYLTLSLGTRSESVGARRIAGFNTTAATTSFKVTQIFGIQE
jgi:hypothetical protein